MTPPNAQALKLAPVVPVKTRSCSTLVSRNIVVSGHRTSVRLEPEMWDGLKEICRRERQTLHQLCTTISDSKIDDSSLTAAIRVYVMRYYRVASTEDGHTKAGHGYTNPPVSTDNLNKHAGYLLRSPTSMLTKTSFA